MSDQELSDACVKALHWFAAQGGDGIYQPGGVILAAGEISPFRGMTFNKLGGAEYLERYGDGNRRVRLTAKAISFLARDGIKVKPRAETPNP